MANLYYLSGNDAISLSEELYGKEEDLQDIVAQNPHLLLRNADADKQLFLVQQELEVAAPEGGTTFYLDHLFIDSTGVPVLVEVKRSTDTRIRREVVGQMLDYASRARSWDVGKIQQSVSAKLSEVVADDFWERVATNLKAERFRLVFVADSIPDSLRTLIEFLDRNLSDIEVYGVEIRQYKSGDRTMLSTNVIESVVTTEKRVSETRSEPWDADSFASFLNENGRGEVIPAVAELREYALSLGFDCPYGRGVKYPSFLLKAAGCRLATVSPWKHSDGFMKCLLELDLPDISASTSGRWSLEEVREMLFDLPNPDPYREKRLLRTTPQTVYIDFSVLLDPVNMQALKDALEAIRNSIPK